MFNPTYLERSRHGIFHFRWPLPRQLHPAEKTSNIKVSLRTREPRVALHAAQYLRYVAERVTEHGMLSGMRYDEIRAVLRAHFSDALRRKQARIAQHGRLDTLDIAALKNGAEFAQEAIAIKGELFDGVGKRDNDLIDAFVEKYGLVLEPGTNAYAQFRSEMQRAYRDYCSAVLDYDQSLEGYEFSNTRKRPDVSANDGSKPQLKDIVTKFTKEEVRAGRWVRRSEDQKRQYLKLLEEVLGSDRDISDIGTLDAQHVKDVLLRYPRNRSKSPATKGLPLSELLEMKGLETLTIRTVNTYLQTYGSLFGWAKRNGYVQENVFEGVTLREGRRDKEAQRDAFSLSQIDAMLHELLANERGLIRKDFQKWGPLIGIYTGARLNEVSQIHLADIRQIDEVWCFDLNDDGDGKKLKNSASRRYVPVHSRLIELGLLDYAEGLRKDGKARLFPEFSYSAKEGYGRALGRWFNERFLVELGIKSKALVFHSLRHTMVTRLMQVGIEESIVKAIVGHTQQGVTQQHYFKQGYTLAQLRDALEQF